MHFLSASWKRPDARVLFSPIIKMIKSRRYSFSSFVEKHRLMVFLSFVRLVTVGCIDRYYMNRSKHYSSMRCNMKFRGEKMRQMQKPIICAIKSGIRLFQHSEKCVQSLNKQQQQQHMRDSKSCVSRQRSLRPISTGVRKQTEFRSHVF